jgi:uncharacterized protein (DUF433 family)
MTRYYDVLHGQMPFTLRMEAQLLERIERLARRRGTQKTPFAERLLEEAVRMEEDPGVVFWERVTGARTAVLAGHRLRVWQVVWTVLDNGGDVRAAAEYHSLPASVVEVAVGYYANHKDEIDAEMLENDEIAREHEDAWRRQQAALGR